jgi:ribokinase
MTTSPLVTVFGSLHYDIAVNGPGRPRKGETVIGVSWHPKSGGKGGNQAVSSARTGVATAMVGAVADDDFGHALLGNLQRKRVDERFVRRNASLSTGMSVAIFDSEGDYGAVIVSGSNLTLGDDDVVAARELIEKTSVLVLQNEVPDVANVAAARAVRKAGGLVLLNAAPARALSEDLQSLVDVIVVNGIEAEMLAGVPVVETLDGALAAARLLAGTYRQAVVTAGGAGVAYADAHGVELVIEAVRIKVESTHGAGDEFIGVLAAGIASGDSIEKALRDANQAAGILVSTPESKRD